MATIPLARWRPDVAALNSAYASDVQNVLLAESDYIPFPTLVAFSNAVGATPTGGFSARNASGSIVIFVGTATKLYKLNGTTLNWDDVSRASNDLRLDNGRALAFRAVRQLCRRRQRQRQPASFPDRRFGHLRQLGRLLRRLATSRRGAISSPC
jgi:hypothetical protein